MFLCVRYSVNGQEYWDNNNSANFQVDFRKKYLPQNGKDGARGKGNGALPRSNRRRNTHDGRPVSTPSSFSEFNNEEASTMTSPSTRFLASLGLVFGSSPSPAATLPVTTLPRACRRPAALRSRTDMTLAPL
uniref:CBM21 domain-containing protein n=1 Tax=Bionectria ochroleuca TaxID=29856 RepID=A0A8H7K1I1_BIOOC